MESRPVICESDVKCPPALVVIQTIYTMILHMRRKPAQKRIDPSLLLLLLEQEQATKGQHVQSYTSADASLLVTILTTITKHDIDDGAI